MNIIDDSSLSGKNGQSDNTLNRITSEYTVERIFAELDAETAELPEMDAAQNAYAIAAVRKALRVNQEEAPIPMLLFCPKCGVQHIDEPDERTPDWTNPPHKSHLCHECGSIWRPADVPTDGVAEIKTRGKADTLFPKGRAATVNQEEVPAMSDAIEELVEALEPFAWIGSWMFARDLPDDAPVISVSTLSSPVTLTRGMFKAAHTARAKYTGEQS